MTSNMEQEKKKKVLQPKEQKLLTRKWQKKKSNWKF